MRKILAAILFLSCFAAAGAMAETGFTPPALTGRVVDEADLLPGDREAKLVDQLTAYEAQTTNQIVVATVPSLQDLPIEDYANRLFRHWALGLQGKDNGVLFLIAPNEREMRIEVGYGLEGDLTDATASLVIRNVVTPAFQKGEMADGIEAGTEAIIQVLSGEIQPQTLQDSPEQGSWWNALPFLLFFGIWLYVFIRNVKRSGLAGGGDGPHDRSGGFGSGGGSSGSSGGGFSGGGGSSGGGGASGRW